MPREHRHVIWKAFHSVSSQKGGGSGQLRCCRTPGHKSAGPEIQARRLFSLCQRYRRLLTPVSSPVVRVEQCVTVTPPSGTASWAMPPSSLLPPDWPLPAATRRALVSPSSPARPKISARSSARPTAQPMPAAIPPGSDRISPQRTAAATGRPGQHGDRRQYRRLRLVRRRRAGDHRQARPDALFAGIAIRRAGEAASLRQPAEERRRYPRRPRHRHPAPRRAGARRHRQADTGELHAGARPPAGAESRCRHLYGRRRRHPLFDRARQRHHGPRTHRPQRPCLRPNRSASARC